MPKTVMIGYNFSVAYRIIYLVDFFLPLRQWVTNEAQLPTLLAASLIEPCVAT